MSEYWHERWQENQTGFHEGKPNDLLVAHVDRLEWRKALRVLLPLCGKAVDLRWLAERGHDVVGVEFVQKAIDEFFAEWKVTPTQHRLGAHDAFYGNGVTLVQADIFTVSKDSLGIFDAIYDRAALVALAPKDRERYAKNCLAMARAGGGIFLNAFTYDQSRIDGPPWSVDAGEVKRLYGDAERLGERTRPANPVMQAAGVSQIEEAAYWIKS